ncbi:hypothetical protein GCM10022276_03880 [Sphingomonas limnosediminicola]|uniref:Uncharacterized protein n=1 Tax=Sphingomonas limnosediminicola TaxID=940133 RepID=A0ABP7KV44_9SPHN
METAGQRYSLIRGSDVDRDGMYLELRRDGDPDEVAEVFYSDETGEFSLTTLHNAVPLVAIEWLIERSRELLPPVR